MVESRRTADASGVASLGNLPVNLGHELNGKHVAVHLDGHLMHVVHEGVLAKTLPAPIDANRRATMRGARQGREQQPRRNSTASSGKPSPSSGSSASPAVVL